MRRSSTLTRVSVVIATPIRRIRILLQLYRLPRVFSRHFSCLLSSFTNQYHKAWLGSSSSKGAFRMRSHPTCEGACSTVSSFCASSPADRPDTAEHFNTPPRTHHAAAPAPPRGRAPPVRFGIPGAALSRHAFWTGTSAGGTPAAGRARPRCRTGLQHFVNRVRPAFRARLSTDRHYLRRCARRHRPAQ